MNHESESELPNFPGGERRYILMDLGMIPQQDHHHLQQQYLMSHDLLIGHSVAFVQEEFLLLRSFVSWFLHPNQNDLSLLP